MHINEYETLFKDYYGPVLRYCCTMVLDPDDAEDIVQHAFVALWRKVKDDDAILTSAKAYLYKAVYNASLDFLKHRKVRKRHEYKSLLTVRETDDPNPVTEKELKRKILESIDQLPEQCRKIFRMNRFEQLKYREIAAKLNIAEKTVENQMGKALKLLRRSLGEYLPLLLMIIYLCNEGSI